MTEFAFAVDDGVKMLVFAVYFPEQLDSAKTASAFDTDVWVLGVDLARQYHQVKPPFSLAVAVGVREVSLARQLNPAMPAFEKPVILECPVILDLTKTVQTFAAGV